MPPLPGVISSSAAPVPYADDRNTRLPRTIGVAMFAVLFATSVVAPEQLPGVDVDAERALTGEVDRLPDAADLLQDGGRVSGFVPLALPDQRSVRLSSARRSRRPARRR